MNESNIIVKKFYPQPDYRIGVTNRLFKIARESLWSAQGILENQCFNMDIETEFEKCCTLNSLSIEVYNSWVSVTGSAKKYELFIEEKA